MHVHCLRHLKCPNIIKQYDEKLYQDLKKELRSEKIWNELHNHPEAGYNGNREYLQNRFKTAFPKSYKKNKEKINKYIERMQVPFVFVCVNESGVECSLTDHILEYNHGNNSYGYKTESEVQIRCNQKWKNVENDVLPRLLRGVTDQFIKDRLENRKYSLFYKFPGRGQERVEVKDKEKTVLEILNRVWGTLDGTPKIIFDKPSTQEKKGQSCVKVATTTRKKKL